MYEAFPYVVAMLIIIVILQLLATKLKIAYPILLVISGLLVSLIPGLPIMNIDPEIIFFIFLPPLLFEATWNVSFKEMRKWWRMITSFAFLVVFFTALSVAIVAEHFIPGFSLALGFLLGGIVSPPDAVSTAAITKFVKIPKSFSAILEGESLLNDASSLIIFRFALLAISSGKFEWMDATTSFVWMIIGGVGVGLILAWLFVQIHKKLPTDAASDTVLTLIEPFIMYWVAEQIHSSGVLAVVCGGLYMSSKRLEFLSSSSRIKGTSVWESFIYILNGIVFLIIGLELPMIVEGLQDKGIALKTAVGYGVLITVVLILARIISSYAAIIATRIFRPGVLKPTAFQWRNAILIPLILGWTGMRGVVSLAAALTIPFTLNNKDFPNRELIIVITFVVILLTLVVQGLTLPYFIKKSKLFDQNIFDDTEHQDKIAMKKGLKNHVYEYVKSNYYENLKDHEGLQLFMKHWEERAKSNEDKWINEETKAIMIEVLNVQRQYLVELNKDPNISEEIIKQQFYQIDLEEERLNIV